MVLCNEADRNGYTILFREPARESPLQEQSDRQFVYGLENIPSMAATAIDRFGLTVFRPRVRVPATLGHQEQQPLDPGRAINKDDRSASNEKRTCGRVIAFVVLRATSTTSHLEFTPPARSSRLRAR
jgi:hypothetical protein